MLTLHTV